MKVFISADIEGVSGINTWAEATKSEPAYREFQVQMTREVAAACQGALAAGATEIYVKDAHAGADNLIAADLPLPTRVIRGWSGHPFAMVQELDESFTCALFVGYHARAGASGNPLSHTLSSAKLHRIFINDRPASEFYIHYLAAALVGVPVALLTGDETICQEVRETDPNIVTVATKDGHGPSTINKHPLEVARLIQEASKQAVMACKRLRPAQLSPDYHLQIVYKEHTLAYKRAQYPGAALVDPYTVAYRNKDYLEILRALLFLV